MARKNDLGGNIQTLKIPKLTNVVAGSSNKELMAQAREALAGNWGLAVLGYMLYIILIISFIMFTYSAALFVRIVGEASGMDVETAGMAIEGASQLVELLVSGAIMVGFCSFFLGIAQEGEAQLELLFTGFRRFWKSFGVYFLYSLFIFLWMLLLIIPGIIAAFRYAMAFFIIADDEECSPFEAISRSKMMMKGNKWKFFCLNFRFFGWALLATFFTLGIGYLWLVPYMQTSFAKFYEDVR